MYTRYMNRELVKALIKDYDLPIAFYDDPYWTHFKTLLEPFYKIEDKINLMNENVGKYSLEDFVAQYRKVSELIIKEVTANPAYQEFNTCNLEKQFTLPPKGFASAQKLYSSDQVDGEIICSIDLIKANFAVIKAFNPLMVSQAETYSDFFDKYSDNSYLKESKKVRQVIFGNLNPKRQQTLQRYYMSWVKEYLAQAGLEEGQVLLASSDELVFKVKDMEETKKLVAQVFTQPQIAILNKDYRATFFKLKKVHPEYDYFVKEYISPEGKIEFKNIPAQYLAQVVRYYLQQDAHVFDRKFIVDGQVATFDKELFSK